MRVTFAVNTMTVLKKVVDLQLNPADISNCSKHSSINTGLIWVCFSNRYHVKALQFFTEDEVCALKAPVCPACPKVKP